jgi:hypothetical protein
MLNPGNICVQKKEEKHCLGIRGIYIEQSHDNGISVSKIYLYPLIPIPLQYISPSSYAVMVFKIA